MLKTYTLYLVDGGTRFEPAMCLSDVEAMARARAVLACHDECEAVDVFFGHDHLFRVGRRSDQTDVLPRRHSHLAGTSPSGDISTPVNAGASVREG